MQDKLPSEMDLIVQATEVISKIVEDQMRMSNELIALKHRVSNLETENRQLKSILGEFFT